MSKMREKCIICEEKINRASNHNCKKLRRPENAVTCNRRCAKILRRVRQHLETTIRNRMLKNAK